MEKMFPPLGPSSGPNFPLPHHIPPSSPPASPPRRRQHSKSISESLADDKARLQSLVEKSQLLEENVLRAYPPAVPIASKRRVTPPQPRLVVPPSPPESFIASGTRRYRSASSATVKTLPAQQEEEPDPIPVISTLKGKLNKTLIMRRGNHSRKSSDVEKSPGSAVIQKNLTPSTINTQSPQSVPTSAITNLSAITTAHTSLYSHTFPVPDVDPEMNEKDSSAESSSSYDLPTYYNEEIISTDNSQRGSEYGIAHRRSTSGGGNDRNISFKGGEVRVEIRREDEEDENVFFRDGPSLYPGFPRNMHEEREFGPISTKNLSVGNLGNNQQPQEINQPIGHKVSYSQASFEQMQNTSQQQKFESKRLSFGSEGKNSDDYADEAAQFFEDFGFGGTPTNGTKPSIPLSSSPRLSENAEGQGENASSSVLGDSSSSALNLRRNSSSISLNQVRRPVLLGRNHGSSSSSLLRGIGGLRPAPIRGLSASSLDGASSPTMDLNDAFGLMRTMGAELARRLSTLSSSGASLSSAAGGIEAGFGAGLAVVVSTDGVGEISDLRGHLMSIADEEDGEISGDRNGDSAWDARDKGKQKEISEGGGRSTEGSNDRDEKIKSIGTSTQPSDENWKFRQGEGNVLVHPGDPRYDL